MRKRGTGSFPSAPGSARDGHATLSDGIEATGLDGATGRGVQSGGCRAVRYQRQLRAQVASQGSVAKRLRTACFRAAGVLRRERRQISRLCDLLRTAGRLPLYHPPLVPTLRLRRSMIPDAAPGRVLFAPAFSYCCSLLEDCRSGQSTRLPGDEPPPGLRVSRARSLWSWRAFRSSLRWKSAAALVAAIGAVGVAVADLM